jgi:hypothetical protein
MICNGLFFIVLMATFFCARADVTQSSMENQPAAGRVSVELDKDQNFALREVNWGGCRYVSGGTFPQFKCIDVTGAVFTVSCTDSRWKVSRKDFRVTYSCQGLEVSVDYRCADDGSLLINSQVLHEGMWRLLSVGDEGKLIVLPTDKEADVSFAACADGGRLYRSSCSWRQMRFGSPLQANFVAVLQPGHGLFLHPEHHAYSIGFGTRGLHRGIGCEQYFRPVRTTLFSMPLCHEKLTLKIVTFSDANNDGEVNWVDAGILYRDRYIKKNGRLDPALREGPCGKLRWRSAAEMRRTLLQLRQEMKDCPITIWALAPTGPSADFLPSETLAKEWRDLKTDMDRIGVRLSPHDNLDDMAPEIAAADPAHIRLDDQDRLMSAYRECFRRALSDGTYMRRAIDSRLRAWSARKGDTWHIDVFSSSPFENYCPASPSTFETDFYSRYDWLKYIHDTRGIHVTSEFLGEGYHEECDYGWWSLFWKDCASDESRIPLLPVLFLGRTYYGTFNPTAKTWVNRDVPCGHPNVGESLLWGVKIHTDLPGEFVQMYETQNRDWAKIADKTVHNITLRDGWWTVHYTDGSTLRVLQDGGRWEEMRTGQFVFEPGEKKEPRKGFWPFPWSLF